MTAEEMKRGGELFKEGIPPCSHIIHMELCFWFNDHAEELFRLAKVGWETEQKTEGQT